MVIKFSLACIEWVITMRKYQCVAALVKDFLYLL